jgi:predicted RNase H-like nuclease
VGRRRVLGVDGCRDGWVGVALTDHRYDGAYLARHIDELAGLAETDGTFTVVAVDIPIGLPDVGTRQADILARATLGPLRSGVFMTPVRAALAVDDYRAALTLNRKRAGVGISKQAYGLRTRILEVDAWIRRTGRRFVEVHPEVSFAAMAAAPLTASKKTWAGMIRRRQLLAAAGIVVPDELGAAGHAGIDDVLDAAAAVWTARRLVRGEARCLPEVPEVFSDGLSAAIWY